MLAEDSSKAKDAFALALMGFFIFIEYWHGVVGEVNQVDRRACLGGALGGYFGDALIPRMSTERAAHGKDLHADMVGATPLRFPPCIHHVG